jgi:hypothetical protein
MNKNQILSIVQGTSGRHIAVHFESVKKPAAAFKAHSLRKEVKGAFRAGIDFSNLSVVKEGIANGERGEVQKLPWGEWVNFPYQIDHKDKSYFRFYLPTGGAIQRPKVEYFVDDKAVAKDEFASYLTNSERDKMYSEDRDPCFVVNADNIFSIG